MHESYALITKYRSADELSVSAAHHLCIDSHMTPGDCDILAGPTSLTFQIQVPYIKACCK